MKVNPTNSSAVKSTDTSSARKTEKAKTSAYEARTENAGSSKKTDSANAEISSKAKDMATAKQVASDTPDVREAKIAELKAKIQNKTYNVSSEAIADRLVDDHVRLAGA